MASGESADLQRRANKQNSAPRSLSTPIYGVTLDDISNLDSVIASLKHIPYFPASRVVFDYEMSPAYYVAAMKELRAHSYIMGLIADSSVMGRYTVASLKARAKKFVSAMSNDVDLWEIGNEVNGNWLGTNTQAKILAVYKAVSAVKGATALTFFYMGEPEDSHNCIDAPGNDMFSWIQTMFQLQLRANQRNPEIEKMRLSLTYVFISWYPQGCVGVDPDWSAVFHRLSEIFPNSKVGFGEIGTAKPQFGSDYEINLIRKFYPLAKNISLPTTYVGGYFWWNFVAEMVPHSNKLMTVLREAILAGPEPKPATENDSNYK